MPHSESDIRASAEREFANHKITELSRDRVFRSWQCENPANSCFHFMVTTIPGSIIVTGDLGEIVVSRNYDMLPWCRGAVDSTHYFASKVSQEFSTEEFSLEKAQEWIASEKASWNNAANDDSDTEAQKHAEAFERLCGYVSDEDTESDLLENFEGFYDEPPDWKVYRPRFLWLREAIRWFVTNHSEPGIPDPKRPGIPDPKGK